MQAQELPRPAGPLGIQPAAVSIREAMAADLEGTGGAKIIKIFPESIAEQMGLKVDDIILALNGQALERFDEIYPLLKKLKAGETITLQIRRSKKNMELTGQMGIRTLPAADGAEVKYETIKFEEGLLRAFVEKPAGDQKFPTIFFLQGYPCSSVEFMNPDTPFRRLINQMVENGYAVFRVEKPGVGDSQSERPCSQIDFTTELKAFKAAYRALVEYDFVDQEQIYLYGHSLGGTVAPLLAQERMPAGIMVYGFVSDQWEDYMRNIVTRQFPLFGTPKEVCEQELKKAEPLFEAYFTAQEAPSSFLKTEEQRAIFQSIFSYDGVDQCINRHYTFWQSINQYDMKAAWKKVTCPVLSMYGAADLAALDETSAKATAELINSGRKKLATFKIIENTDHSLIKVGNKADKVNLLKSQEYKQLIVSNFNTDYFHILNQWINENTN